MRSEIREAFGPPPWTHLHGPARRARRLLWRLRFWASIVWRPVTGDRGDSWFAAWRKYRLDARTAWEVTEAER